MFEYIHRFGVPVPRVLELAVGARPVEGYGGGLCCDVIVDVKVSRPGAQIRARVMDSDILYSDV